MKTWQNSYGATLFTFFVGWAEFRGFTEKKIHSFYFFFQFCLPYLKSKSDKHEKNGKKLFFFDFSRFPPQNDLCKTNIVDTLPKLNQFSHLKSIQTQYHFSLLHFTIIWEKKSKKINFLIRNDFIIIILYTVTQI